MLKIMLAIVLCVVVLTGCGSEPAENEMEIANVEILHGHARQGDIPHSLASIEKAKRL